MLMKKGSAVVVALISVVAASCTGSQPVSPQAADEICDALVGPEPWLILFTEKYPGAACVAVGVHQDLQIWNKGTESLTVEWLGRTIGIESDYNYETGPIGNVLEPGRYLLEASPYRAPDLHVVDPDESPSAQTELTLDEFGGIQLGMTVAMATEAFGHPIAVDPNLAPGPDCWQAVVVGDPYSPIFTVDGDGNSDGVITAITTFYPLDSPRTSSDPNTTWGCDDH